MPTAATAAQKKASSITRDRMMLMEGTSDLFATFRIRTTHDSIQIESRMGGSIWNEERANVVTIYNNENKVYFLEKIESYLLNVNQDFLPIPIEELEAPTKTTFQGRPAKFYKGFAKVGKLGRQHVADITCIESNCLSPAAHRIWCRFLGVNVYDIGIPVLLKQKRAQIIGGDKKLLKLGQPVWCRALMTNTIKELPLDKGYFAVKSNWKQAKDRAALLFSKDGSLRANDLDDFFRSDASKL